MCTTGSRVDRVFGFCEEIILLVLYNIPTCDVLFNFFIVFRKHCLRSVLFTQTNGSEIYLIRRLIARWHNTSGHFK